MKKKEIISGILALGVLVGSGYGIYNIGAKDIIGNQFKPNVVYAEKNEEVKNQDLKNEAKKIFGNYFQITPDLEQMEFSCKIETKQDKIAALEERINLGKEMLEALKSININNINEFSKEAVSENDPMKQIKNTIVGVIFNIKSQQGTEAAEKYLKSMINNSEKSMATFEEIKNRVKYGTTYMGWTSEDGIYTVTFDDETEEMLSAKYELNIDAQEINPDNFMSIEDAQQKAEEFLIKNNLDGIKQLKLIKQEEFQGHLGNEVGGGFDFNAVAFFYEDANDLDKRANIVVDRVTKEVTEFAVGKAAQGITYKTSPN